MTGFNKNAQQFVSNLKHSFVETARMLAVPQFLLQTQTATLNGELNQHFECWYPGFPIANHENHDLHEVKLAA